MMEITLNFDQNTVGAILDEIAARAEAGAMAGGELGIELIKERAVAGAPVRSGHLRGSAETLPLSGWPRAEWRCRFPGPYARRQHFELSWRHPHGGHALYLYLAQAQSGDDVIRLIRDGMMGAL